MSAWNPEPHWPNDYELLERATRGAMQKRDFRPRWCHVMDLFGVGSTVAQCLCRRFNLDPDEVWRRPL